MLKVLPHILSVLLLFQASLLWTQTLCFNEVAGGYACDAIDLQSVIGKSTLGTSGNANDIWGWTDPTTAKEYAIIGLNNGTAFVDITNAASPINLGFLPTHSNNSLWRDIKVVGNYAYIVSEAGGHGIQVFDLTRLRSVSNPPITFTEDGHAPEISNAHNIVGFPERDYVVAVGSSMANGGLVFFDVGSNPTDPTLVGAFSADGYTHDAICFVYRGPDKDYIGKDICIGYNEDTNTIVDATDKSNITLISKTPYTGSRYTHQGWVTDDHRYMLVNDELDESNNGHNTRTYIFDISDLDSPIFMGYHEHPFASIDHNLYIKGRYAYLSNYSSGLRVLDIADIMNANLVEVASFDTYTPNDNANYSGTWSNYPYFKSGNVIVSGIQEGLFVVKPNIPHFTFGLSSDGIIRVCPGGTASITLDIDAFADFSETINLSLSGLDPSLTATLDSPTVSVDGQVSITVTAANTDGDPICVGNFCVLLTGVGNNARSEQSIALGIIIDNTLPSCPPVSNCPDCANGIQDDDETGIDCGGPNCPACIANCENPVYVNCNSIIDADNTNGLNVYETYNGIGGFISYIGREMVYTFTVATGGMVNIDLTGLSANLDIFLYGSCDPNTTLLGSSRMRATSPEFISATLPAGTYYLFIDGVVDVTTDFNLSISCPSGSCFDGVQNDNETGIDCGGVDCAPCINYVHILPKVFLQGAFSGLGMNTDLSNIIPSTEPYTALGYSHVGGGNETTTPSILATTDIVDWVVVELRDKSDASNVVATRSALLKQDGTIVSHTDGISAVQLQATPDDYYIVVRHRNHLGVMTTTTFYVN